MRKGKTEKRKKGRTCIYCELPIKNYPSSFPFFPSYTGRFFRSPPVDFRVFRHADIRAVSDDASNASIATCCVPRTYVTQNAEFRCPRLVATIHSAPVRPPMAGVEGCVSFLASVAVQTVHKEASGNRRAIRRTCFVCVPKSRRCTETNRHRMCQKTRSVTWPRNR